MPQFSKNQSDWLLVSDIYMLYIFITANNKSKETIILGVS